LASGSDDGTVRLWDFQTQTLIKSFQSHASRVWSVAFFRQTVGQKERLLLASGGDDQTVMVASVVSEPAGLEPIKTLRGYANSIRAIELVQVPGAAVDLVVGGGDDNDLKVWKVQDGKPLSREPQRLVGHMGRIWSVSVHVPSGQIATGSDDHSVRLWDLHTGQCQTTLAWHKHWVRAVTFSPDGKFLASAGDDRLIQLWKMPTVEQHRTLTKHRHWVTTLAFSRDSHYLASGSDDRQVILWDVQTGKQLRVFEYHQHRVRSVAFGPNNLLASASDDCSVAIWNLDSDQARPVHVFEQGGLGVRSVVFSGARWLLGGGDEPVVNVWRVGNWDEHYSLAVPVEPGQPFGLQGLSVSADEQYLVGCDRNGTVLIWSLEDRQLVDQIRARRPYENMEIKHVTGLGPVQKATLRDLGAIDETSQNLTAV
ncbi:MAG: WD40 repeat domain-containing protein, partial [Cyanobacteria bacterium P01_D01_bin.14]